MSFPVNTNLSNTVIQNSPLNLFLKARIKTTPLHQQTATPRVHFASTEGENAPQKHDRQKCESDDVTP